MVAVSLKKKTEKRQKESKKKKKNPHSSSSIIEVLSSDANYTYSAVGDRYDV